MTAILTKPPIVDADRIFRQASRVDAIILPAADPLNTIRQVLLGDLNLAVKKTPDLAAVRTNIDDTTQIYEETISSYEYRVSNLEEKNAVCEIDLMELTLVLKKNEKQIQELQQDENVNEKV